MPVNVYTIQLVFSATQQGVAQTAGNVAENVKKVGDAATTASQKVQSGFQGIAGAFTALVIVKHVGRLIGGLVKPAVDAQAAMATLHGTLKGLPIDYNALQSAATAAATATKFSPVEAIQGLENLVQEGVRSQAALEGAIGPALKFAQASGVSVAQAARLAAVGMRELNVEGSGLGAMFEKAYFLTQRFGVPATELPKAIRRLSESMAAGASDVNSLMLAVGMLTGKTGSAARSATLLSTVYMRLGRTDVQEKLQKAFGIALDPVKMKKGADLIHDVLLPAIDSASKRGMGLPEVAAAFGQAFDLRVARGPQMLFAKLQEGIRGMNGVLYKGADAFKILELEMASSNMLTDVAYEKLHSLSGAWERLSRSIVQAFLQTAAEPLVQILTVVVDNLAETAEWLSNLVTETGPLGSALRGVAQFALGLGVVVTTLVGAVVSAIAASALFQVALKFIEKQALQTAVAVTAVDAATGALAVTTSRVSLLTYAFVGLKGVLHALFMTPYGRIALLGLTVFAAIEGIVKGQSRALSGAQKNLDKNKADSRSLIDKILGAGDDFADSAEEAGDSLLAAVEKATKEWSNTFSKGVTEFEPLKLDKVVKEIMGIRPATEDQAAARAEALDVAKLTKEYFSKATHTQAEWEALKGRVTPLVGLLQVAGAKKESKDFAGNLVKMIGDIGTEANIERTEALLAAIERRRGIRDLGGTPEQQDIYSGRRAATEMINARRAAQGLGPVARVKSGEYGKHIEEARAAAYNRAMQGLPASAGPTVRNNINTRVLIDGREIAVVVVDDIRREMLSQGRGLLDSNAVTPF